MATPIKTSKSHDRMLEKINLSGVSELLNIKQDIIKHNLFNSFDSPWIKKSKYRVK